MTGVADTGARQHPYGKTAGVFGANQEVDTEEEDEDADGEDDDDEQEEDSDGDYDTQGYQARAQASRQRSSQRSSQLFPDDFDDYSGDEEEGDVWLGEAQEDDLEEDGTGDASNMMLTTATADQRIFKEAEDIFRATSNRSGVRRHSFKCATFARDIYSQADYAPVTEPPELILDTESLIALLYKDGVGTEEDDERLDRALATVTGQLTGLWKRHVDDLPMSSEEHVTEIGPAPSASSFEKAVYVATLALQVHHTRTGRDGRMTEPLPETLFRWMAEHHNPYPNQIQEVLDNSPSPASHTMFWPTVCMALLRGQVSDAQSLLIHAGWEKVRGSRRGDIEYSGRALENVRRAAEETCAMLEECPAKRGNWEIWDSEWTLFRIKARAKLEQLRRFAEGKNAMAIDVDPAESHVSLAAAARKAESQVPWDIYENLNVVFEIALGSPDVMLETAQDWVEATIGLFGWWDETNAYNTAESSAFQALALSSRNNGADGYMERLARCLQTAVGPTAFHFNALNPVEVGMACVFEDNAKAVIAILRTWSLPVAAAVAEIASLGRWLPQHQPSALYAFDDLDADDLEVLGINPEDPDEADGIKDNTLIQYAQELTNYKDMSSIQDASDSTPDGWEVAIHVLGRMDSPKRSEETVGELVQTILQEVEADSSEMVDKVWRLLKELGMKQFAEQVADHFGDMLRENSDRFGEAMWYYALAHRTGKVRDVMQFLIGMCLFQSAAYPATIELDGHLRNLLKERNTTLEQLANEDLEAAEVLGKMLAGYATLRKFYEIRDNESLPLARRQQSAAGALTLVIASSDDNIRGGLYDASRDVIVGEEFLLALLGEVLVFVNQRPPVAGTAPLLGLEQVDILLKAVEDIQSVGGSVYKASNDFFQLVLASAPALLKGSTPADLLKKTASGSVGISDTSMLASQLHRSVLGGAIPESESSPMAAKANSKRGWDWRTGLDYSTTAEDVLRILRLGLTKELAKLWLLEADGGMI
ncbi:hypothetical protein BD289DRAFT_362160 [Coniella lustricola]|uniref:Nuclear pore complex protein Nup85 n=1 Tax=Coniella lustricola TaxID=2025994 RepID=A0A2T3AHB1_9PEZI|nr:hypothetical protein BD289DRAFT_362160 [Coniella lustricola]